MQSNHQEEQVLNQKTSWQTQQRGSNMQEYLIYLACADNGSGGDITRGGQPLLTFAQWMAR